MVDDGFTGRRRAQLAADPGSPVERHGQGRIDWLAASVCTSPALSPDGATLAYVSDQDGLPQLWLDSMLHPGQPVRRETGADHVRSVSWSPDGEWLCVLTAADGGERTRVLALRPDGSQARIIGGTPTGARLRGAATMGRWQPGGHVLGMAETAVADPAVLDTFAVDVCTGRRRYLTTGVAPVVSAFSHDGRYAVVRVGRRGERQLLLVDTRAGTEEELLAGPPHAASIADARFAPDDRTIYLHTDAGTEFARLLALPRVAAGYPEAAEVIAAWDGVELEWFALDPTGRTVAAVWNVAGRSMLELIDLGSGQRRELAAPNAEVITGCAFAFDGGSLLLAVESSGEPAHVLRHPVDAPPATPAAAPDTAADAAQELSLAPVDNRPSPTAALRLAPAQSAPWPLDAVVRPTLHTVSTPDGLELFGWLYRPDGALGPLPTMIWLHGGPEAQERPTFQPLYQELLAHGVAVFAPNVRGSSGYGRSFVNADNLGRRPAGIRDVSSVGEYLVSTGLTDAARLACAGRSYGGYLTLAAMVSYPELFRVGVSVCGIADFTTFFAQTEPWIAAAATSKYGDPQRDSALLDELSPIHRLDRLTAPLLVVHGAQDTNVPLVEARSLVDALCDRGSPARLLLFDDEGHEIGRRANRSVFVHEVVRWLTGHLLGRDSQTA